MVKMHRLANDVIKYIVVPTKVDKNARELATLSDCAVPFLSRGSANLCWCHSILIDNSKRTKNLNVSDESRAQLELNNWKNTLIYNT